METPSFGKADIPAEQIREIAYDPAFLKAMEELFQNLTGEIETHKPECRGCGSCCRFEEFDHRLFVTTAELAWIHSKTPAPKSLWADGTCPWQVEHQCTARQGRPTGCRIFFCDPQEKQWQGPLTEETLARLRAIHDTFALPYVYVEWLHALEQLYPD